MNRKSQTMLIRRHLESGKTITSQDALDKYGCFRLAARIYDLSVAGMNIGKYTVRNQYGNRFAVYYLRND